MRRILLILFTIAMLIGMPRLADRFREHKSPDDDKGSGHENARDETRAKMAQEADQKSPTTLAQGPAVSVPPLPVPTPAVPTPRPQPEQTAAVAPAAMPATGEELVIAIKSELTRLGYYDGPINDDWSQGTRLAARKFTRQTGARVRHGRPTLTLLAALRASKPDAPVTRIVQGPAAETQKADIRSKPEPLIEDRSRPEPIINAEPKRESFAEQPSGANGELQSDGYLPPWQRTSPLNARLTPSPDDAKKPVGQASGESTPETKQAEAPEEDTSRSVSRRRHRTARAARGRRVYATYGYGRAYVRHGFAGANFSWPGF